MFHPQEEALTVNFADLAGPQDDDAPLVEIDDDAEVGESEADDEEVGLEEEDLDEVEEVDADEVFDD